jgi:membrane protease subunit HflC
MAKSMIGGATLLLLAILSWSCLFTITENQRAILLQMGELVRADYKPGLHLKMPIIEDVIKFEKRLINLDSEAERYLTEEKKDLIVDFFARWRITDEAAFFRATSGDERRANSLLGERIKNGLRSEFGQRKVKDVVSGERGNIMLNVTTNVNKQTMQLGVEVVDVRIKRIDLPPEVSNSVYQRMRAERERAARKLRSEGAQKAEGVRAGADRDRTIILANAYRQAEMLRGEGDAKATEIYAKGFGQNEEFYAFYRSLSAYKVGFQGKSNVLVLQPDSEFFQYFGSPKPGTGTKAEAPAATTNRRADP